ncbi:ATP-binding protein [Sulfurimonas crateris]|uniref:ATP-binding protein n=1 Tax=Sulfurimonas crateris TaxID=2574727 RepID=A0A4U2Z7Z8_9BACT|nr:AAA family ATPase [Sulfurimonas crateris]TKI69051.1 ATP-binding protein [Sulfurimonas crateris]
MIEQLQEKQRKLVSIAKNITYLRKEFDFINSDERLIALIGARGVGKTTLLLQYLGQYSLDEALYFSADDISIAAFGIVEIVEEFYKLGGRIVVIDEVHMFKEWAAHIKNLYDFYPDLTIRISGSSMLNILMQSHDLSRRILTKELGILSFKEYFEIKHHATLSSFSFEDILSNHNEISYELICKYPNLYKEFKNYLKNGAYPFFTISKSEESFASKLFNSIEKIIYEDIPSTQKIKFENLISFKKLIYAVVSAKVPYSVKIDSLAKELGVSEPTLYTYLDILDKTGIFRTLKKQSTKQSKKPEKLYFQNTNILYTLASDQKIATDIGAIRETFFVNSFKEIYYSDIGDFVVDGIIFEVGGKGKSFSQVKDIEKSYLAIDVDTTTHKHKVPLWLFGFLY